MKDRFIMTACTGGWLIIFLCLLRQPSETYCLEPNLKVLVGVMLPHSNVQAVEKGFMDLLSHGVLPNTAEIELLPTDRHYHRTFRDTVAAQAWAVNSTLIIGPFSEIVMLAAEDAKTPYLVLSSPAQIVHHQPKYILNMLPQQEVVHRAVLDLIYAYKWTQAAVIYNNNSDGLHFLGDLMTVPNLVVKAWKYDITQIRKTLVDLRQQNMNGIVLAMSAESADLVLKEGLRLSMLSNRYSWILVTLKPGELNPEPYDNTLVNMTTFRFVEEEREEPGSFDRTVARDAFRLVNQAVSTYISEQGQSCHKHCTNGKMDGKALMPYLQKAHVNGSIGSINFDGGSDRFNISLSILTLTEQGFVQYGTWNEGHQQMKDRLKLKKPDRLSNASSHILYPLGHEKVRIVTIEDPPFVMQKKEVELYTGNERYEGYLIDLIERISNILEFEYILYPSPDGNYGSFVEETGSWNGMIGELINGEASMCLGAISITSQREEVVDFTKPFMQKQYNILIKKPKEKTSVFQFLWPLSTKVWLITSSATIFVGFLLYLMDKVSPNFKPRSQKADEYKPGARFGLRESMWFTYGSLVGAGTEIIPRTVSGRFMTGAWWFFSLILVSSYTANLAAFLTVTKIETPIKSVADLVGQTKYKFGTVKNTNAHSFFKNSDMEIFSKMWTFMGKIYPDSMVDNSSAGVQKVKEGDYAFIWDGPVNKYFTMTECDTMTVGQPFDEKGLGIGVPLGAAYRDDISMAILNLAEDGTNQKLYNKWWTGGKCEEFKDTSTESKELDLSNVAGMFIVLGAAAVIAFIISLIERLVMHCQKKNEKKKAGHIPPSTSPMAHRSSLFMNGQDYGYSPDNHYEV